MSRMLPVQKKMDYRSRGIANGDTGDETGAKGVPPNLFLLKNDIKLAFINRFEAKISNAEKD